MLLRYIPVTIKDVKQHMGDTTGTNDAEVLDKIIQGVIDSTANLIIEDKFSITDVEHFTPNQVTRAIYGVSMYIAGKVLEARSLNSTLTSGGSVHLGPLSTSGWSSGGAVVALLKKAKDMMQEADDILDSLRILRKDTLGWGVVDGTKGGVRYYG